MCIAECPLLFPVSCDSSLIEVLFLASSRDYYPHAHTLAQIVTLSQITHHSLTAVTSRWWGHRSAVPEEQWSSTTTYHCTRQVSLIVQISANVGCSSSSSQQLTVITLKHTVGMTLLCTTPTNGLIPHYSLTSSLVLSTRSLLVLKTVWGRPGEI